MRRRQKRSRNAAHGRGTYVSRRVAGSAAATFVAPLPTGGGT